MILMTDRRKFLLYAELFGKRCYSLALGVLLNKSGFYFFSVILSFALLAALFLWTSV